MLYGTRLPAEIKKLNRQLESHFGIDTASMNQMWRVSWSDDQYEIRRTKFSATGIELLYPIELEMPKYQHVKSRWILENYVGLNEISQQEIVGAKTSYECMYAYPIKDGKPLIPSFAACRFIADLMLAAKGKESMGPKYVDPYMGLNKEEVKAKRLEEIKELEEELFGDESFLMLRTVTGEAIAMPPNYKSQHSQET